MSKKAFWRRNKIGLFLLVLFILIVPISLLAFDIARTERIKSIKNSECKAYYDGCNTCTKGGLLGNDEKDYACTIKYCGFYGWPYCRDN